jgi:hypothetical protein
MKLMDEQASKIEELMDDYQLSLPKRPPKSVRTPANTEGYEDRFIGEQPGVLFRRHPEFL